jgi:AAHS family 4-hydroxybenzoate transporter-like MFS transporter
MAGRTTFDVSAALETQKLSGFTIRLICISWLVTFFDAFDMNVIAFTSKQLEASFNLTHQMLGQVFSIGVFGTLLAGFLFGYIGDWIGRRPAIIFATGAFSALTIALAFAWNFESLLVLRFLNGLALGGAMPLIWALNMEYAPKRMRATVITVIMLGYGLGVAVSGPVARLVLPTFDWPGVFIVGGSLSFVATLLLFFALPESLRFLTGREGSHKAIHDILRRMKAAIPPMGSPDAPTRFVLTDEAPPTGKRFNVAMLFEGRLRWLTPLLWLSYFSSSISTFFLASWGPLVLQDLGFSADHAAWVSSMNSLCSATGGLLLMRFTDRHGPIAIALLPLTAVPLLLTAGLAPVTLTQFIFLLIPISVFLGGSHYGITSIVSMFYPSPIRASGTGWCSGVAKIGSVLGPLIGGYVLATSLPVQMTYALLAACPLVYGVAVLTIGIIVRRERDQDPLAAGQVATAAAE